MLTPIYRKSKISHKLSFRIRDQSIFLRKRITSASKIRVPNTKELRGLPSASVPPDENGLDTNHRPTGLDPQMSIQKVGTERAWDTIVFRLRSIRRSTMTRTMQSMRTTVFGIASIKYTKFHLSRVMRLRNR